MIETIFPLCQLFLFACFKGENFRTELSQDLAFSLISAPPLLVDPHAVVD